MQYRIAITKLFCNSYILCGIIIIIESIKKGSRFYPILLQMRMKILIQFYSKKRVKLNKEMIPRIFDTFLAYSIQNPQSS